MIDNKTLPEGVQQVAVLFANRWVEATVSHALRNDGMSVESFTNTMALVTALHAPKAEVALVEDHGVHFASCLAALRFRGFSTVPIVAVGRGSAEEIAQAFRYGASDYAVVNETMGSLVNRVRARIALGRYPNKPVSLTVGPCVLDEASRTLRHPGGELHLTSREFALAWILFEQAGRVVNLHTLSQQVWGRDASVAKRTIEQHVSRLRAKLVSACLGAQELLSLQAIHNVGYRMVVEPRASASLTLHEATMFYFPGEVHVDTRVP